MSAMRRGRCRVAAAEARLLELAGLSEVDSAAPHAAGPW